MSIESPQSGSSNRIALEVTNNELPLLKSLLNRVDMQKVNRVSIEIESDNPMLLDKENLSESSSDGEKAESAQSQTPPGGVSPTEPETNEEFQCECGRTCETKPGLMSHQRSCDEADTDGAKYVCEGCGKVCSTPGGLGSHKKSCQLVSDDDDGDGEQEHITDQLAKSRKRQQKRTDPALSRDEVKTGEQAYHYAKKGGLNPEESKVEDFAEFEVPTIKHDTQAWYTLGMIYRSREHLSTKAIHRALEGTEWEVPYSSLSAQLSKKKSAGLIYKDKKKGGYQMTQLGNDLMKTIVLNTPGYHLTIADKVTKGDHPSQKPGKAKA